MRREEIIWKEERNGDEMIRKEGKDEVIRREGKGKRK